MNRRSVLIHRFIQALCILGLIGSIGFYLSKWSTLPAEPGIHFDASGNFDVHASKIYGFYPHLITLISLIGNIIASEIIIRDKLKLGLRVTETGRKIIICSLVYGLDIIHLLITVYFMMWSYSVSQQSSFPVARGSLLLIFFNMVPLVALFQIIVYNIFKIRTKKKYTKKEKLIRMVRFIITGDPDNSEEGKHHVLFRVISWLTVAMILFIVAFTLERLPSNDLADNYHGLAYFKNADAYLPKWLVFLPYIITVPFMVLFEIAGIRSEKKKSLHAMVLADRLKLIFAVWGSWWEMVLDTEEKISKESVIIFLVLCTVSVVRYFLSKRLDSKNTSSPAE